MSSVELGEPNREVWIADVKIEEYDDAVRLVQPRDGQLAPESIVLPAGYASDAAEYIGAFDT